MYSLPTAPPDRFVFDALKCERTEGRCIRPLHYIVLEAYYGVHLCNIVHSSVGPVCTLWNECVCIYWSWGECENELCWKYGCVSIVKIVYLFVYCRVCMCVHTYVYCIVQCISVCFNIFIAIYFVNIACKTYCKCKITIHPNKVPKVTLFALSTRALAGTISWHDFTTNLMCHIKTRNVINRPYKVLLQFTRQSPG